MRLHPISIEQRVGHPGAAPADTGLAARDGLPPPAARFALTLAARFHYAGMLRHVRLIDLSREDANLAFAGPAALGQIGLLAFGGVGEPLLGHVAAIGEGRIGFRFAAPLAAERIEAVLRRAESAAQRS